MAELTIRFDVRFSERWCRGLMAAAMFFAVVPELASESVTLTTYYPAPSGVYASLITTGATFLARDSGAVIIGQTNNSGLLTIDGASTGSGGGPIIQVNGSAGGGTQLTIGGEYIRQTAPANSSLFVDASGNGNVALESVGTGNVTVGAVANPNVTLASNWGNKSQIYGDLNIGGTPGGTPVNGYLQLMNPSACAVEVNVNDSDYGAGGTAQGTIAGCGAGNYVSWQQGIVVQGWSYMNRGGQVVAESAPGVYTTQVWGLNTNTSGGGQPQWMTLTQQEASSTFYCCPL